MLGAGYALLAAAIFVAAWTRHKHVYEALQEGDDIGFGGRWIVPLTVAGGLLALATLLIVVIADSSITSAI